MGPAKPVIVIGIDGATFDLIDPFIEEGRLPNLEKLLKTGVRGKLRSTIPTISAAAWTSFSTGMGPARHGIYDFVKKVPGEYRFAVTSSLDRKTKPVWMLLSEIGKKVCTIGCTLTYPPDNVNGVMMSGLGTPNRKGFPEKCEYSFPASIAEEIENKVGRYHLTPHVNVKKINEGLKKELLEVVDYKAKLNRYFFDRYFYDFNMYFFGETDLASHFFWDDMEFIKKVYEKIDGFIGGVISDDVNIIVMSDHGFAKKERMLFMDRWLQANGYLSLKRRIGLIDRFTRPGGDTALSSIYWQKTAAFSGRSSSGSIFINLKGRDQLGVVEQTDYESLCKEISSRLEAQTDPKTGKRIIKKVYLKKEILQDVACDSAPDLVPVFMDGFGAGMTMIEDGGLKGSEFIADSIYWKGDHEINGIFIGAGPAFKQNACVEGLSITDLAPTIMYIAGVPICDTMDGKVAIEAIRPDFAAQNPVRTVTGGIQSDNAAGSLVKDEERMIAEALKNLGYIE